MNLTNLKSLFADNGCKKIYIKTLSARQNSKNQVYFGGSFEILNMLPISEIINVAPGDWNSERFIASIKFSWIDEDGKAFPAPKSKLILYPKYPEVRFSGFLQGCQKAPSKLMNQVLEDRLLFFSVTQEGVTIGYVTNPTSEIAREFSTLELPSEHGVFKVIELEVIRDNKIQLLEELYRIHTLGWIKSKRLDRLGNILPCDAPNCGGYTLEAELGITPNGYSEPDFLGWEIKQFGVSNFNKIGSKVVTLMTPNPNGGSYSEKGVNEFVTQYGYLDKKGREDRINFGGVHKVGNQHHLTNLRLELIGFDRNTGKIRSTDGKIALVDIDDNEAASWSFSSMLLHWNRKHNQACYVPSLVEKIDRKYKYGNKVILGTGTDFQLFLGQMAQGNIYYDPGIKMENASTNKPSIKERSQFRIKSEHLPQLYKINEVIDVVAEFKMTRSQ